MHGRIATLGIAVWSIAAISSPAAYAQPGNTVYSHDFSSDPGWTTDNTDNYYWDEKTQTFHAITENAPFGDKPTRYAYIPIDYDGGSIRLEFDMQPIDLQFSAGVAFGLFDQNLCIFPGVGCPDPHFVHVHIGLVSPGFHLDLRVRGATDMEQIDQVFNVISEDTWYRFVLEYLSTTDTVTLTVTDRKTGDMVATLQITEVGGLPDNLDYFGFARDPAGNDCCPDCQGYTCSNQAIVNLDNVSVSQACPGDLDGDGGVGVKDLLILLGNWGPCF